MLVNAPIPVRRVDFHGMRFYQPIDEDDGSLFRPSTTSILNMINKPELNRWRQEKGLEADKLGKLAMMIGDIIHRGINRLIKCGDLERSWIMNAIITHSSQRWDDMCSLETLYKKISRRMDGFKVFWDDKQPLGMIPIASEIMLYHKQIRWAGTCDLVTKIRLRSNSRDLVTMLIDYKTGKEYKEHPLQLASYAMLWNKHIRNQDLRVTHVGNLYLGDLWKKTPKYKLKVYPLDDTLKQKFIKIMDAWVAVNGNLRVKDPEPATTKWEIDKSHLTDIKPRWLGDGEISKLNKQKELQNG
jgi:hypothetical protein